MDERIEKLVVKLFEAEAVKFGSFKLKSGILSPVYFDLRVIISFPELMNDLAILLSDLMALKRINPQQICGVPYTALPIATLVCQKTNLPMVIRRKEGKKEYGTKKVLEGRFTAGESCVVIEDVITSGGSVFETVQDLKTEGLVVQDAVVVLDREQGGFANLSAVGINVHVLVPLSKLLQILQSKNLITNEIVQSVLAFTSDPRNHTSLPVNVESKMNPRLTMSMLDRMKTTENPLAKRILNVIHSKQSLLVVAIDVTTSQELLEIAEEVGTYAVAIKTHVDIIQNFSQHVGEQLKNLAMRLNFFIIEDRKFGDIGNVVSLQFDSIVPWADLVTVHSVPGPGVVAGLKASLRSYLRGGFLVAEMSSSGALTGSEYAKETLKMAEENKDFIVGLVCQSKSLISDPGFLQLTPGIHISSAGDSLGQQYVSPRSAVIDRGADLAVVGRGIVKAGNRKSAAEQYKNALWEAYCERIS